LVVSRLFWEVLGYPRELGDWLTQLLERHNRADALRVHALVIYGQVLMHQGDLTQARGIADQSLQLSRALSNKQAEAFSLWGLGAVNMWQGDIGQGTPILEQSLALYQLLGDKFGQAVATGWLCMNHNDLERPKAYLIESLRLHRELRHLSGIAGCLNELARLAIWESDFSSPIAWLEEAQAIYHQLGDEAQEAAVLENYGNMAFWMADYEQACVYHQQAIVLNEKGNIYNTPWFHADLAYARLRQGNIAKAKERFEFCIGEFQRGNNVGGLVFTIEGLASLNVQQERVEHAAQLYAWADAMRKKMGDSRPPVEQASVGRDLEIIHSKLNDSEFAQLTAEGQRLTIEKVVALALEV